MKTILEFAANLFWFGLVSLFLADPYGHYEYVVQKMLRGTY